MTLRQNIFNMNCKLFTAKSNKNAIIKQTQQAKIQNYNINPLINKRLNVVYFSQYMIHPVRNYKID